MDDLVTQEFNDEKILSFATAGTGLEVIFSGQANIIYSLPREREDFVEQAENIAAAWQSNKPVKVVLHGAEVFSVSHP